MKFSGGMEPENRFFFIGGWRMSPGKLEPLACLLSTPHKMICRFCLESEDYDNSPFIAPCKCKGSVEYVHWKCLKRWILIECPVPNRHICSICKFPFETWAVPKLEHIPHLDIISHLIFNYSGTYGTILQYIFLLNLWKIGNIDLRNNVIANMNFTLTLVHVVYTMFLAKHLRIHNWLLYYKSLAKSSLLPLLACHGICLFYIHTYNDKFCSLPIYLIFNVYWKEHLRILNTINRALLTE